MRDKNRPPIRSSVIIAKMLNSEGYTPAVHNGLRRYCKKMLSERDLRRYDRTAKAMSDTCAKLSQGDRFVIGRFIAWQSRFALDTGLRVGLAATLTTQCDLPPPQASMFEEP